MTTQLGYLFIADITGYTLYLNQSELEHARDSLTHLLELLIEYTRPPLTISKLEGDAVFSYALAGSFLQGQTLIEMIELTYLAFRKALKLMVLNTTCQCNACRNIPNLDLKFFVHYGAFSTQDLGNYRELIGNDVNIVHRLGKNNITATLGFQAYAAYTATLIKQLELYEIAASMQLYRESYDDVGEIQLYVQDLHAVWNKRKNEVRAVVKPEEAFVTVEQEFPIPPPLFWEYITKPEYRALFHRSDFQKIEGQVNGRTGPESIYSCAHGKNMSFHTILDWEPFEQYTSNETNPMVPAVSLDFTYHLKPTEHGTKLIQYWSRPKGPWLFRTLFSVLGKLVFAPMFPLTMQALREQIQSDLDAGIIPAMESGTVSRGNIASAVTESLDQSN